MTDNPEFVVSDPDMIKLITSRSAMAYFGPFLLEDRSVAEAAVHLDKPIGRVHYWVRRMHAVGLLKVVEVVPRAGRPIKRYRAVSQRFRVPARLVPVDHFEHLMTRVTRQLTEAVASVVDMPSQDLTISPSSDGNVSMDRATDADAVPAGVHALQTAMNDVWLTEEQAETFWTELTDLRERLGATSAPHAPGSTPYLIQLAMVPARS